jgi:stromal membrane-associated protein
LIVVKESFKCFLDLFDGKMSQAQYKKRLKALMNKPENQVCSDCPERQPRWASLIVPPPGAPPGSLPIGAFCCLECSGSHRRLGVHISFVRSINLDSWKEKEVLAMENGGNKKVNAIFEARLNGAKKPTTAADGPTRERFIRDKYERRKYYDASVLQNYVPDDDEEEEPVAPTTNGRRTTASRQPSEAARLRAESRRQKSGAATSTSARPRAPKAAPPPEPAAAQVDLLDFAVFDSPAPAPAPAATPTSPNLDLFANMTVSDNTYTTAAPAAAATSPVQPARKTNDDIMAMFSAAPSTNTQMSVGMATPNGGMMAMSMPSQPMMQQQQQQPNMMMMPPQQQPNIMLMQQGQTQQNTMFMQQQGNAMMMQQQGNNTFMVQKNTAGNFMMMQQGQPQPNMMQMMQQASNADDFGFPQAPMGSGPPIVQDGGGMYNAFLQQQQSFSPPSQQPPPSNASPNDPFASFGNNVFR